MPPMNAQPSSRAARPRSSRARALAVLATTSAILLWGAAWVALGIAAVSEVGA
jgi:hypothetical protein